LYNIYDDPCEYNNLATEYPDIAEQLLSELRKYYEIQEEPVQLYCTYNETGSDPDNHDGFWKPWRESSIDGTSYITNNNDIGPKSALKLKETKSSSRKYVSMILSSLL